MPHKSKNLHRQNQRSELLPLLAPIPRQRRAPLSKLPQHPALSFSVVTTHCLPLATPEIPKLSLPPAGAYSG
jgi:hypothetical protein